MIRMIPFDTDSEVLESEITDPHISIILEISTKYSYHMICHKSIADKSIFNVGNCPTRQP